jgi:hypothetical protein
MGSMRRTTSASISISGLVAVLVAAVTLVSPVSSAHADIYVFTEKDGTVRFTNRQPPTGVKAKVFTGKGTRYSVYGSWSGARGGSGKIFRDRYNEFIRHSAAMHRVDPSLIKAVIHAESAFNPRAVSPKGALGLMQLMPDTARQWGVRKPFDPASNIHGGTQHLAMLLRKYHGNLVYTIAAYNAGEEAVRRHGGIPPYQETRDYVKKVLHLQRRYAS